MLLKSQARAFFLGGTALFSALFIGLPMDSVRQTALLLLSADYGASPVSVGAPMRSFLGADGVTYSAGYFDHTSSIAQEGITFFGDEQLLWNDFEPNSPVAGVHAYDWWGYDDTVRKIEAVNGDIAPTLMSASGWGTIFTPYLNGRKPSSKPKSANKNDYYLFVRAFMERYDKDGKDDMDGLLYAHNYLQIEDEAQNLGDSFSASGDCDIYSPDSAEYYRCAATEYGQMLKIAYLAAHDANPNARVISFSFNPGDYFDDNPPAPPPPEPKLEFLDELFTKYDAYFDIIGLQCNYDYTGIKLFITYIKEIYNLKKPALHYPQLS